jgi:hypothetical protein
VVRKTHRQPQPKWTFLRYAAESWYIHARRSIEISKDKFCDDSAHNWLQHQFFETSDIIRKPWIELCGDSRMEVLAGEQTPLHIAVCLGLMPLVEKALSDFTKGTNSNWSPLHLAARFISGAYKILIAKGGPSLLTCTGSRRQHTTTRSSHFRSFVHAEGPGEKIREHRHTVTKSTRKTTPATPRFTSLFNSITRR